MDINIDSITPDSSYCQSDTDLYPPAGHVVMHNLNDIPEGRVSNTPPQILISSNIVKGSLDH